MFLQFLAAGLRRPGQALADRVGSKNWAASAALSWLVYGASPDSVNKQAATGILALVNSRSIRHMLTSPLLMWALVIVGVALAWRLVPARMFFTPNVLAYVVLALAAINWLYFFVGAAAKNRFAIRSAAGVGRLATTGVYAKIRHPIYFADIILAWGIFFAWPTLKVLCSAAWLTTILVCWMKLEELALVERFDDQYRRYRSKTPMFLPRFRRR